MKTSVIAPLEEENVRLKAEIALLQSDATARQRGKNLDGSARRETVEVSDDWSYGEPDLASTIATDVCNDDTIRSRFLSGDPEDMFVLHGIVQTIADAALQPPPRDGGQATGAEPDGAALADEIERGRIYVEAQEGRVCAATEVVGRLVDMAERRFNQAYENDQLALAAIGEVATLRTNAPPAQSSEAQVEAAIASFNASLGQPLRFRVRAALQAATVAAPREAEGRPSRDLSWMTASLEEIEEANRLLDEKPTALASKTAATQDDALATTAPATGQGDELQATRRALECDRSIVALHVAEAREAIAGYDWLREAGRGSYAYDDDRYQREFGDALDAIERPLRALAKIAKDWTNCPTDRDEINRARRGATHPAPKIESPRGLAAVRADDLLPSEEVPHISDAIDPNAAWNRRKPHEPTINRSGLGQGTRGVDGVEASAGSDDPQERDGRGVDGPVPRPIGSGEGSGPGDGEGGVRGNRGIGLVDQRGSAILDAAPAPDPASAGDRSGQDVEGAK